MAAQWVTFLLHSCLEDKRDGSTSAKEMDDGVIRLEKLSVESKGTAKSLYYETVFKWREVEQSNLTANDSNTILERCPEVQMD